jgi:hypothetical protein
LYLEAAKILETNEKLKTELPVVFAQVDLNTDVYMRKKYTYIPNPPIFIFRKHQNKTHKYDYHGPKGSAIGNEEFNCRRIDKYQFFF